MKLGVNIDHIATLRNARGGSEPEVLRAALICEESGAFGITTHLREDRRQIKDSDVEIIDLFEENCHDFIDFTLEDRELLDYTYAIGMMRACYKKRKSEPNKNEINCFEYFYNVRYCA